MAPFSTKQTVRRGLFTRALLRAALCLPSVALTAGCSFLGYKEAASDAPDASADASEDSDGDVSYDASDSSADDASDSSTDAASDSSTDAASDSSTDAEEAFDAASDGSTRDGSDGAQDAARDARLEDAELDGSSDAAADASTDGASQQCDGMVCPPRCDLTGTYALKLRVPTTWPSTSQINGGSGTFEFRLRMRATHVGNTAMIELQQCGQTVPVIQAQIVNESSLFTFPDSLFDSGLLPGATATMTLGDSTASSSLSLPPVAMQLGLNLNDPLNDPWPSTAAGLPSAVRVDVEGDGNPSVTAVYSTANGYMLPRTSATINALRARQAYIAIRRVFSLSGMLMSCDAAQGTVDLVKLDSHMLGCRHADGSLCSNTEANNLDTGLPKYQFSAGTYALSRVADNASCAALRALP